MVFVKNLKFLSNWILVLDLERRVRKKEVRMMAAMNLHQNHPKSYDGVYHGKHGNLIYPLTINMQVQGRKGIGVEKRRELNF